MGSIVGGSGKGDRCLRDKTGARSVWMKWTMRRCIEDDGPLEKVGRGNIIIVVVEQQVVVVCKSPTKRDQRVMLSGRLGIMRVKVRQRVTKQSTKRPSENSQKQSSAEQNQKAKSKGAPRLELGNQKKNTQNKFKFQNKNPVSLLGLTDLRTPTPRRLACLQVLAPIRRDPASHLHLHLPSSSHHPIILGRLQPSGPTAQTTAIPPNPRPMCIPPPAPIYSH